MIEEIFAEDENNIEMFCSDCADKRKDNFQESLKCGKVVLKKGGYAKICFFDGRTNEHMWVCLKKVFKKSCCGKIANVPAFVNGFDYNQEVEFSVDDVEDYYEDVKKRKK